MINGFPKGCRDITDEDFNPSIRLVGRRFMAEQQTVDLLAEFLLIMVSKKHAGNIDFAEYLPSIDQIKEWNRKTVDAKLSYEPQSKLNLKLFAFLSSSRLESRHKTHREHAEKLYQDLAQCIALDSKEEKARLLKILSNLLLGYWGNGAQRTWCAQTFLPFCKGVLGGDVIWNETAAKRKRGATWEDVLDSFETYFATNKHRFLARGGEALYLQLCNAFTHTKEDVTSWLGDESGLTDEERDPKRLRAKLAAGLKKFFDCTPPMLGKVMELIDVKVDSETSKKSDFDATGNPRRVSCGWIPEESWREGYLFAVELSRILSLDIGVMECVELLGIGCVLQEMRSLAAQSYRHSQTAGGREDGLDYRVMICDNDSRKRKAKLLSAKTHAEIAREIQQAIRIPEIQDAVHEACLTKNPNDTQKAEAEFNKAYKDADTRYGFKLYRKVGKSIGLIVPPTGASMHYTLNDKILRYLVLSLIPQERMTLNEFKMQMAFHHGFVFTAEGLRTSRNWVANESQLGGGESTEEYLEKMLDASGVLVRLSDSCSLVKNPYAKTAEEQA